MSNSPNLIISEHKLSGFWDRLMSKPSPEPGIAIVLVSEGQPLRVLAKPEDQLTIGEFLWGKYTIVYRVDISKHDLSFDFKLPCKGDAFSFQATADISYKVIEPAFIVEHKISDIHSQLKGHLVQKMRGISRKFSVKDSENAELEIMKVFSHKELIYNGVGVENIVVSLSPEENAITHARERDRVEKDMELNTDKIASQIHIANKQEELDALRREFEHRKIKDDIKIESEKFAHYSSMLEKGEWQLLALHLSQNPNDVAGVFQLIQQQRASMLDFNVKALESVLTKANLQDFELHAPAMEMLSRIVNLVQSGMTAQLPPGNEGQKSLPLEAGTEGTQSIENSTLTEPAKSKND